MLRLKGNFWNGLIAGSIVGGILGLMMAPQSRASTARRLKNGGLFLTRRAQRIWKRTRGESRETMEKAKH